MSNIDIISNTTTAAAIKDIKIWNKHMKSAIFTQPVSLEPHMVIVSTTTNIISNL